MHFIWNYLYIFAFDVDVQDLCTEMPCGGKCIYQNRYNQFACVCPEPFYLDADGISCILEKEVPEYEQEDVLIGIDRSQTSTTTTEEAKEIDQPKNYYQP